MKQELKNFGEIELSRKVLQALREMGFEEPSPIQAQTIPLTLEGHDVIGQAQTGYIVPGSPQVQPSSGLTHWLRPA